MTGVNRVILIGRLGKDPEIKGAAGNVAVLSMVTSDVWRDKASGEKHEETEWHRVVVFDKTSVEFAEKYLKKGMMVYVEGKNATRKWTSSKDNVERYTTEVVVKAFKGRLQSLEKIEGSGGPRETDYGKQPAEDLNDEIPF